MEKTERSVLNAIVFSNEILDEIEQIISPNDFLTPARKNIYAAMLELRREDSPIDDDFILKKSNKLRPIDQNELVEIMATTPIADVKGYAQKIKEDSIKRQLHSFALLLEEECKSEENSTEILDRLQARLFELSQNNKGRDFRFSDEIVSQTMKQILAQKGRNSALVGLDTGFMGLNKNTAGFGAGDLIIIAARPSMGKTAFVLNIAQKVARNGVGVAFFSLEMPAEQLMLRMFSAECSLPLQDLRIGRLEDSQWEQLSDGAQSMSERPFFVDDSGELSIHQMRSKLRKLRQKQNNIGLVIVDYLQLMKGSGKDRISEISEISRGLKTLAREQNIPIIALSQLSRALESRSDRRPQLSDLRESGAIEQDADLVMFVYREAVYKERDERQKEAQSKNEGGDYRSQYQDSPIESAEIIIAKHRNGPIGKVNMEFHKHYTRFSDIAIEHENAATKIEYFGETKVDFINPV